MAWITDAQLKAAIAMRKHHASAASLPDNFLDVAPRANASAYARIRGVLARRGFSTTQMDSWAEREQWNEDLGVTFAEWRTADPADRPQAWQEIQDMLEELKEIGLFDDDGGELVPTNGAIGYGDFETDDDTFTIDSEL